MKFKILADDFHDAVGFKTNNSRPDPRMFLTSKRLPSSGSPRLGPRAKSPSLHRARSNAYFLPISSSLPARTALSSKRGVGLRVHTEGDRHQLAVENHRDVEVGAAAPSPAPPPGGPVAAAWTGYQAPLIPASHPARLGALRSLSPPAERPQRRPLYRQPRQHIQNL